MTRHRNRNQSPQTRAELNELKEDLTLGVAASVTGFSTASTIRREQSAFHCPHRLLEPLTNPRLAKYPADSSLRRPNDTDSAPRPRGLTHRRQRPPGYYCSLDPSDRRRRRRAAGQHRAIRVARLSDAVGNRRHSAKLLRAPKAAVRGDGNGPSHSSH